MKRFLQCLLFLSAAALAAWGQPTPPFGGPTTPPPPSPPQPRAVGGGRLTAMPGIALGKWWDNPDTSARLGLSDEQRKKMDDVFQASRIKLIDLRAALEREEAMLDPLMQAANPDDSKLLPQIDRVAEARAELKKADARLLLGLRHVLSPQQWQNLEAMHLSPQLKRMSGSPGNPPPPPVAAPPVKREPGGEGQID